LDLPSIRDDGAGSRHGDVQLDVDMVIITEMSDPQVVNLRDVESECWFPLVIGYFEAVCIDRRLRRMTFARPLLHDVFASTITAFGGTLRNVLIDDMRDNVFFAKLRIERSETGSAEKLMEVDIRPSDAIALAITCDVPIRMPAALFNDVCLRRSSRGAPST
jgi:bifunctional DNase/RNase